MPYTNAQGAQADKKLIFKQAFDTLVRQFEWVKWAAPIKPESGYGVVMPKKYYGLHFQAEPI